MYMQPYTQQVYLSRGNLCQKITQLKYLLSVPTLPLRYKIYTKYSWDLKRSLLLKYLNFVQQDEAYTYKKYSRQNLTIVAYSKHKNDGDLINRSNLR